MDYRRLTKSTKKTRNKSQMHSNNAWANNTKRTNKTKMIKTRMLGIFNNLLLECQSNNHLECLTTCVGCENPCFPTKILAILLALTTANITKHQETQRRKKEENKKMINQKTNQTKIELEKEQKLIVTHKGSAWYFEIEVDCFDDLNLRRKSKYRVPIHLQPLSTQALDTPVRQT